MGEVQVRHHLPARDRVEAGGANHHQHVALSYTSSQAIKKIEWIGFPNLKSLNLQGNRIESIEGLSRIQMNQLEIFYLCNRLLI